MIEATPNRDLEQCKELVQRIAESSYLNKSARLTDMFLYLCAKVLDEGVKDIHELEVGQQVFGRQAHYDTTADNIVRVHASMLRKRLREYFATDGCDEQFIVEIPRGNYAPLFRMPEVRNQSFHNIELEPLHFTDAERIPQAPEIAKASVEPARLRRGISWASWVFPGLAIAFALLSTFLFIRLEQARSLANSSGVATSGAAQQFWSQIFRRGESVDIVLNDASLGFYQEVNGHPVALADYFDRSYLQSTRVGISTIKVDPRLSKELMLKRQSDFSDAAIVWKLAQMAERLRSSGQVQFARELSFRQVKSSSLVLLGNPESNPWIQLFENNLSLQWKIDPVTKVRYPIDTKTPADQNRFHTAVNDKNTSDGYATMSFLPNLSGTGNVLIISATGGSAVDAAMEWLSDSSSMRLLLSQLPHANSGGFPYFETLLKIEKGPNVSRTASIAICRPLKVPKSNAPRSIAGL